MPIAGRERDEQRRDRFGQRGLNPCALRDQHLRDTRQLRRRRRAFGTEYQKVNLTADLRGGRDGAARGLGDGRPAAVGENQDGHLQITFASLRSFATSSCTEPTFTPAWRFGGSSTFSTVRRGVTSTPRSAGLTVSIGFLRAFMMFGSDA